MTKEQLIERYGIEWYEAYKVKCRQRKKERYDTDAEYREAFKVKCNTYCKERYANDAEYRETIKYRHNTYQKERYANDSEFREAKKAKANTRYANDARYREALNDKHNAYRKERYVIGSRIDLVENYELAKTDNFKGWHIHHKDEIRILPSGMIVIRTKEELIENGRYYDCPPNELIWMRQSEHVALHNKFRTCKNA